MRDGAYFQKVTDIIDPVGTAMSQCLAHDGDFLGKLREERSYTSGILGHQQFMLVQASATIAQAGGLLKCNTSDTTGTTVLPTAAATDIVAGVAPPSFTQGNTILSTIVSGQNFWMQIGGVASVWTVTGATAGLEQSASGTAAAGQNAPFTAATQQGVYGVLLQANSSGVAALRPVRLQGLQ